MVKAIHYRALQREENNNAFSLFAKKGQRRERLVKRKERHV